MYDKGCDGEPQVVILGITKFLYWISSRAIQRAYILLVGDNRRKVAGSCLRILGDGSRTRSLMSVKPDHIFFL